MTVGGCHGNLPVICHSWCQTHEEEGGSGGWVKV